MVAKLMLLQQVNNSTMHHITKAPPMPSVTATARLSNGLPRLRLLTEVVCTMSLHINDRHLSNKSNNSTRRRHNNSPINNSTLIWLNGILQHKLIVTPKPALGKIRNIE